MIQSPSADSPYSFSPEQRPDELELALSDGYETRVFLHKPTVATRLPVIYLHGIQSHPAWFYGSAMALAEAGHPVYQPTRRGSEFTPAPKGHATCPKQVMADIDAVAEMVIRREGVEKFHLVGVSLGGKLATVWALDARRQEKLANLTLIAPGLCSQIKPSRGMTLKIVAALLTGRWKKPIPIPLDSPALFTDNPVMREYLENDPAQLHYATARFFSTMRRLDWMLQLAKPESLRLPVNLLLSERDKIIDNDKTLARLTSLAGEGLQTTVLPGAHTLEFEENPSLFLDSLIRLLATH